MCVPPEDDKPSADSGSEPPRGSDGGIEGADAGADSDVSQKLQDELRRREMDGDATGLDQFNSELYDHLKRRPEFADRALYDDLSERVDVEENVFGKWREQFNSTTKLEPTAGQTPGEVIELVLRALQDVDYPHEGHGIEVLQRFSSNACIASSSKISEEMLYSYVKDSKLRILLDWVNVMYSKKLDTSFEGKRAYQELRLKSGTSGQWLVINFMLGLYDDIWLVDHIRVRGSQSADSWMSTRPQSDGDNDPLDGPDGEP